MATTLERFQEVLKPVIFIETSMDIYLHTLHLDPIDMVMLITDLEDEFDVLIKDEDVEKFKTVGDICHYIDQKLKDKEVK